MSDRSYYQNFVAYFEIYAIDPQRAAEFYRALFGWKIRPCLSGNCSEELENQYWTIETGEESRLSGGILFRQSPPPRQWQPLNAFVCIIQVTELDLALQKAFAYGATQITQKMKLTNNRWLAYCLDTEGNRFGMLQDDNRKINDPRR